MRLSPIILFQTHGPDRNNGRIDAVRASWLFTWPFTHKFVFPSEHGALFPDEIGVDAPDGLTNTSLKIKKAAEWCLANDITHAFIIPTDCYVVVPRLLKEMPDALDAYVGYHTYDESHIGGGSGYWVGPAALRAMANFDAYPDYEDRWTGAACNAVGIRGIHDPRYTSWEQPETNWPGIITRHLSRGTGNYDPKLMLQTHREFFEKVELWTR